VQRRFVGIGRYCEDPGIFVDVGFQFVGDLHSFLVILRRDSVVNSNSPEECLLSHGKQGLFENGDIKRTSHLNQRGVTRLGRSATVLSFKLNIVGRVASLDTAVEIDISKDRRRSTGRIPVAGVRES
jgi:hypothetical protein